MEISLRTKDGDEIRLQGLNFKDNTNEINIYRFVQKGGGPVLLKLELIDNRFEVIDIDPRFDEEQDTLNEKLDELLLSINPKNASLGSEGDDDDDESDPDNPYNPDQIRVDTKSFSLRQIYDMIKANDIDLTPDFQRHLVWDQQRKSRLIESILLRIPLPIFYFAQDEEGKISVVDGLQRLSTIREFMDNELRLKKLEYLEERCGHKHYKEDPDKGISKDHAIEPKYFRWFNMTQITVNVIDPSSPFKLKYDIFRRINTGGQPLNAQEIRNCLSSPELRSALRKMSALDCFKTATGGSIKDVRMESQELALRFILFRRKFEADKKLDNYNGNIESELNSLTEHLVKSKSFDYGKHIAAFDKAMKNAYHLFGRYAFRKCRVEHIDPYASRQLINKALFVSWSVLLSYLDHEYIKDHFPRDLLALPLAEKVTNDTALFQFLTYSTNSKANIQASFAAAQELIDKHINSK